jgi:hypothetical protein
MASKNLTPRPLSEREGEPDERDPFPSGEPDARKRLLEEFGEYEAA